jgi:hypothetical protein
MVHHRQSDQPILFDKAAEYIEPTMKILFKTRVISHMLRLDIVPVYGGFPFDPLQQLG